jgi:hypothetical protein
MAKPAEKDRPGNHSEDYAKGRAVSAVQLELESGMRWLREIFIHQNQTGKENSHQSQQNELHQGVERSGE